MPRLSNTVITKAVIDRAKPRSLTYEIRDAEHRGFLLRIYPTGKKVFVVQLKRNQRRKIGDAALLTLTAARHKAQSMQVKHHSGEIIESSRNKSPTVRSFLQGQYFEEIAQHHKQPDASVKRILAATKSLADQKLHRLSEFDIRKWMKGRIDSGISKATINRDLATLKRALNVAVELGLISTNPTQKARRFKNADQPRERYLTADERNSLLNALRERDAAIKVARKSGNDWRLARHKEPYPPKGDFADYLEPLVLLVLNTGLRRNEALSLRWENVKLGNNPELMIHWTIAKSQRARHIPLNATVTEVLKKWRDQTTSEDLVFTNNGKQMNDVRTSWKNLMRRAQIKGFRFHDLRHDFASQLVMAGKDLYRVKNLLGHASITTTERYAHLSNKELRDAVNVLDKI